MTKQEAIEEIGKLHKIVRNWRAKDPWHEAVRNRNDDLFDWAVCVNGKDPGPWEMPPIPEGVEP